MAENETVEKEEAKTEESKLHAKPVTLWGQIIAAVWVIGWGAFWTIKNVNALKVTDIIFLGFAIAGCFSPTFFNMFFDKIKNIKWGAKE